MRIDVPPPSSCDGAVKSFRLLSASILALLAASCAPAPVAPGNYYVDVEFTVTPQGKTTDAKVIKTNAPKEFQQEALREVSRYKAEPATQATRGRRTIEYNVEAAPPEKKQQ